MGLSGIACPGLLMYLAYRSINVLILALILSALAVLMSGQLPILATYTQVSMEALGGYVITYFPLFLLGAIFAVAVPVLATITVIVLGSVGP